MKRHNSNNVKMLKMAASAAKETMKLIASERKSVASIRFGKPKLKSRRCEVCFGVGADFGFLERFVKNEPSEANGSRLTIRNSMLSARIKTVASHGPM
jgi:hypothetical protein